MGQRANLVIVEADRFDLYYSHWCANTLPRDLFWGPAHAEQFIRIQRQLNNDDWLDTVWAEGGALIDKRSRVFVLYGGEDINYNVPSRRLFLKLLAAVWQDWTIRWAYEGIVDIAEYVGVHRQKVIVRNAVGESDDASLKPPEEPGWVNCVGSIEIDGNVRLYPLAADAGFYLGRGPTLCNDCDRQQWYPTLALADRTSDFPTSGFHIDTSKKTVDFWVSFDCAGLLENVRLQWPGWNVTWHKDAYESQAVLTKDLLKFNAPPEQELMQSLQKMLMVESKPVDVNAVARTLVEGHSAEKVEINPYALRDDRLSLGERERQTILNRAFAQIGFGD
jgi:hypothetical protein